MFFQGVTQETVSITEWVSIGSLIVSFLVAIFVVVKALIDKFGKSPEARQAEIALGVGILQSQIVRNVESEDRWLRQEQFLRDEIRKSNDDRRKSDEEKENLEQLLEEARKEIRTLRTENELFRERQRILANKIARGEPITLADITGESAQLHVVTLDDDDMEDTFRVH